MWKVLAFAITAAFAWTVMGWVATFTADTLGTLLGFAGGILFTVFVLCMLEDF